LLLVEKGIKGRVLIFYLLSRKPIRALRLVEGRGNLSLEWQRYLSVITRNLAVCGTTKQSV
jgi:hypothetical protein